ncbi:putative histidine kinase [Methanocella paludicola SANAE]|uniref:histidine kinase n=1 Tax=Methanocella paludicola (strain DSM 17711 / JCM 13418 / NBRC 101707 / SANAE) TaxID=304371 RepID=D1YZ15_METPS|nr:putative histidine kinase [Methanocella paludicola SANAE]
MLATREALEKNEELFRVLADTSLTPIFLVQNERFVYTNPAAQNTMGYSDKEFLAMDFWEPIHPDHREQVKECGLSIHRNEHVHGHLEVKYVKKTGEEGWAIFTAAPTLYKGEPACVVSGLDITKRKRAETALTESEEKFRVLTETSRAAIFFVQNSMFNYVNPAASRILGYSEEELLHMKYWEVVDPSLREQVKAYRRALISGEQVPRHFESQFLKKNGETGWCDLTVGHLKYKGNHATVIIAFDITMRKFAEIALRESEEKFRVLSETSPAAIFLYQENKLIYANPAAVKFTGFDPGELLKKNFWDMVHPKYRDMVKEIGLARQKGEQVPSRYEVQYITSKGEVRWAEFAAGLIDYKGKPAGIVIALDITDRKQAEASLMESKAQADLYVDLMGHDINNLNQVALGYLELATERLPLDESTREFIVKPMEALEKSSRLIEKVRKLQMMRSGHLESKTVDVGKIIEDVVKTYSTVPGRDITIHYTPARGLVSADELLTDVFSNLVVNAIKHSPCDRPLVIDIGMSELHEGGKDFYRITVDDNGPGIPDERKEAVFGRFSSGANRIKGSGLGLYLVKSLVESYGGRVWVENRVAGNYKAGSRFVVVLPSR